LKLKRSACFAKVAAKSPIGRDTRMNAHWTCAHGSSTTNQVAQPRLFGGYAERSYRHVCDTGACLLPDVEDAASRKNEHVFYCRLVNWPAVTMSSNFMRCNAGIPPHAQGIFGPPSFSRCLLLLPDNMRPDNCQLFVSAGYSR
jgi:hypothetical protein